MKISEVQIDFIKSNNGLIAFASLVINGDVYLSSIGIYKKLDGSGYRLTYPSKGTHSVFYPINRMVGQEIEEAIFKKLKEVMKKVIEPCSNTSIPI
jgi:DNA-binding cell septation regulator SpoVG